MAVSVGLPVMINNRVYNGVALVTHEGIQGISLKRNLAANGLHYEQRWFTPWTRDKNATVVLKEGTPPVRVGNLVYSVNGVKVGFEILKSLGLRHRGVNIISCPSCARQGFDVIKTVETLEKRLEHIKTPMSLSIIGCVVNGPGEALMTDVGFTGGGAGSGMVYLAGKASHKMSNEQMVDHIVEEVEKKAAQIEAEAAAAE